MKAIIVDLDKTLLRTDKTLSEYTLGILRKCHEKGIPMQNHTANSGDWILCGTVHPGGPLNRCGRTAKTQHAVYV